MKFGVHIHDTKLQNVITNYIVIIEGYIYKICRVLNKVHNETIRPN